ncbi:MAG: hypothetical protein C0611_12350 [Desulfobacteraceae bacterium]|nr:MAG: hypothetical protein C0611_12350 [Desulfobacteraceae bacterium]
MDKTPSFFEIRVYKKCGLYVKQNIELRHSDRHKEMLHNTPHYKVLQFDNVLMIHVYLCQTTFTLN